jgi:type III secretion system YscJ/HrcJ family lipoprotein
VLSFCVMVGCSSPIHHDLDERAANDMVVALGQYGVLADKASGANGWTVLVPSAQRQEALAVLAGLGLPRIHVDAMPEESGGLVPSESEERTRRAGHLEARLSSTLSALDGVREAHVHVTLPIASERLGARAEGTPARASVVLVHRADQSPPSDEAVRAVLMGAVDDLSAESIAVVRSPLALPPPQPSPLSTWGPLAVGASSVPVLNKLAIGGSALVVVLSIVVMGLSIRLARKGDE